MGCAERRKDLTEAIGDVNSRGQSATFTNCTQQAMNPAILIGQNHNR